MHPILRRTAVVVSACVLFVACGTSPALAGWPHSPFVNVQIPSPGGAQKCAAAEDGVGGAFVVFEDLSQVGSQGINVRAHHVLAKGSLDPAWTTGVALCTATGGQTNLRAAPDGSGGFYAVWQDARSGTSDIYGVRVNAAGAVVSGWTAGGKSLGGVAGKDDILTSIAVAPNGSLFVGWHTVVTGSDYDAYVTQFTSAGALASGWPSGGLNLHPNTAMQGNLALAANAYNGVDLAYEDATSGTVDIVGGRLTSAGSTAWSVTYCGAASAQYMPQVASDGLGGVLCAWQDMRASGGGLGVTRIGGNGLRAAG